MAQHYAATETVIESKVHLPGGIPVSTGTAPMPATIACHFDRCPPWHLSPAAGSRADGPQK